VFASCMPRVQLYVNACNGWQQFARQHHWLLPIDFHFLRLYSAAGCGIAAVSSAIEESDLYLFYKSDLASGGYVPLTPTIGSASLTPLGAQPPDSRYKLALCTRHGVRIMPRPHASEGWLWTLVLMVKSWVLPLALRNKSLLTSIHDSKIY